MSIGREFMERTRFAALGPSAQQRGEPQPPLELRYDVSERPVELPTGESFRLAPLDLPALIERRATRRNYSDQPLAMDELSFLLWATQGIKELRDQAATLRTVPSAGARHAFETILLINAVAGIAPGFYRYLASLHYLVPLHLGEDGAQRAAAAALNQEHVARSAATFFWVVVTERMIWRYGERGYRYLHLDAGHVCQNLYLAAEAIGCGVCAIGSFDDEATNRLLGLDGAEQFVIYMATVGKVG